MQVWIFNHVSKCACAYNLSNKYLVLQYVWQEIKLAIFSHHQVGYD